MAEKITRLVEIEMSCDRCGKKAEAGPLEDLSMEEAFPGWARYRAPFHTDSMWQVEWANGCPECIALLQNAWMDLMTFRTEAATA